MEGRQAVSKYLQGKKGFLLISHDRSFLDGCINHVISINRNSIDVQSGNFSTWYENKEMRDQFEISENNKLQKDIKRLKSSSCQSKNWSNKVEKTKNGTRMSGSKVDKGFIGHKSAKMMQCSKNLENRQNKAIKEKESLLKDLEVIENLKLHTLDHHKDNLITATGLSVSYGNVKIFENLSFEVNRGDRIAVQGKNGSGKSTLIKILAGINNDYTGNLEIAKGVKISYLPQDTSYLKGSLTNFIRAQNADETLCKTILRKLDFSRALFEIEMQHYSDGQKKKVLLAISLATPAHIFIWDEPLNYIDVISRIQIEKLLQTTRPTIIFVEHDQKFTEDLATKIISL